jgi:hypothetical protein
MCLYIMKVQEGASDVVADVAENIGVLHEQYSQRKDSSSARGSSLSPLSMVSGFRDHGR